MSSRSRVKHNISTPTPKWNHINKAQPRENLISDAICFAKIRKTTRSKKIISSKKHSFSSLKTLETREPMDNTKLDASRASGNWTGQLRHISLPVIFQSNCISYKHSSDHRVVAKLHRPGYC